MANLGGPLQPVAWLYLDSMGNITHTFYEDFGVVGQPVPAKALIGRHIVAAKKDKVLAFLTSLSLSPEQAREVVEAVGVEP